MTSQAPLNAPLDKNKANGSLIAGVGTGALVGTVIWQAVAQIWPEFHPTPEYVLLTTAAVTAIGSWLGAYFTKHGV